MDFYSLWFPSMKHHDLVQDLEVGGTRLTAVSVYFIKCKRIWKLCPLSKDAMPMCPRPMRPQTFVLGQCVLYVFCQLDDAPLTDVSRLWTSYRCWIIILITYATPLMASLFMWRSNLFFNIKYFLWGRIFKRLRSPGIDSKEWIPPACSLAGRYDK